MHSIGIIGLQLLSCLIYGRYSIALIGFYLYLTAFYYHESQRGTWYYYLQLDRVERDPAKPMNPRTAWRPLCNFLVANGLGKYFNAFLTPKNDNLDTKMALIAFLEAELYRFLDFVSILTRFSCMTILIPVLLFYSSFESRYINFGVPEAFQSTPDVTKNP